MQFFVVDPAPKAHVRYSAAQFADGCRSDQFVFQFMGLSRWNLEVLIMKTLVYVSEKTG